MTKIQDFDYSVNLLQAILWQYNDAVNIISLTEQKQAWYDENQTAFWQDWFTNVFNLQTANQFGLAVWSFILFLPIFISTSDEPLDYAFIFGFNEYSSFPALINTYNNFNGVDGSNPPTNVGANFSDRGSLPTLNLEEQRFVLQLRYFQLTTRGDTIDINVFLNYLYRQKIALPEVFGPIWVLEVFNMTMRYVFPFNMSPVLIEVLQNYDLLPRPAGVGLQYYTVNYPVFGFDEVPTVTNYQNQNFFNSNFIPDSFFGV